MCECVSGDTGEGNKDFVIISFFSPYIYICIFIKFDSHLIDLDRFLIKISSLVLALRRSKMNL